MMKSTSCTICNVMETLKISWLGKMFLPVGALLAAFSMVAWPLMFVWPVLVLMGAMFAIERGACNSCEVSFE